VLGPEAAAGMISVLAPAAGADAVDKGRSWLAGMQGKKVASPAVTIVDDALWEDGPAAFPFDDEGFVARTTTVIREGKLESYLNNSYYGTKAGTGSTGNGMRSSYYLPPGVDATNWLLLPGKCSEEELIGQVSEGLLVLEILGLHTADPVTGEFSLGVSGHWIRRGRIAEPVAGATISGELSELLERVAAVADAIKYTGEAGAPAVLVEDLDVCARE
jgi:PmbA protein